MIIFGIDASTSSTGYSVFKDNILIDHGRLTPKSKEWRDRIMEESLMIAKLFKQYKPETLYIEDVPMKPGSKTLEKLGAVQGMILCLCAGYKVNPVFLLPSVWRRDIDMFDGSREGTRREILKEKAIQKANELFDLDLKWFGPTSKKSEDDEAEGILVAYSQILKSQNHV